LDNVSFSVDPGEVVTLIGPNGAGKSTVMKIALGLLNPDSGKVRRARGITIGYMPQNIMIEDILPLTVRHFLMLRPGTTRDQAQEVMALVRVAHVADSPVQRISGGEMQRALLARAMLGSPDLIVLDEPVQGVDIAGQQELYHLISRIKYDKGCGVLMISHDLHMVMAGTDKIICLNRHICCSGTPENIHNHPEYHAMLGSPTDGIALYTHHHNHHHDRLGNVVGTDHHDRHHDRDCNHD